MTRRIAITAAVAMMLVGVLVARWWLQRDRPVDAENIELSGNVDVREVELAFNGTERIATLIAKEGQRVKAGDFLGSLETVRFEADVARAAANLEAQRQMVSRLEAGSRPEEIRKARADVVAGEAELNNARIRLSRARELVAQRLAPQAQLDDAQAAADSANAQVNALRAARDLVLSGPRVEDVAAARATRDALVATLALANRQLEDARLYAPADGIIRNRVLESGDMASPQRPVYTLALTDPMWVRVYVEEPDLGRIREGQPAEVLTDSFPGKRYAGWVGYISPTAEFTPKPVETRELRSQLVYQARIYVCNPESELRLGMPATVTLQPAAPVTGNPGCPEQ